MRNERRYFVFNGEQYYTGTVIRLKVYDNMARQYLEKDVTFFYVLDDNRYVVGGSNTSMVLSTTDFFNALVKVVNIPSPTLKSCENTHRRLTFIEELGIEGMLAAWIWYIFIMLVAVIFNDCIIIWISASLIFFNYRNRKIKGDKK